VPSTALERGGGLGDGRLHSACPRGVYKDRHGQARYFSISADEITSSDNQSWLSLHAYIPLGFKRCSILLALIRLVDGNGADAIREAVISMVHWHSSLNEDQIPN
jgi:hypothetical protein